MTEADGRQVNYTYDELYRLTEENINNGERVLAYTYDSVGNRLTKDDSLAGLTTYTYDANDRLLSEVLTLDGVTIHTITYTYDDNGNLLSRTQVTDTASETTTYTWNDDDRLVAVATPDGSSVTYEYDEEGIRVSSTVDGVTTDYLVDKNRPYAQVLEELNSEQLQAFYVYGHDLISQTRNTQQDFYQVDGLGSTRALTDENGNVTDTYDYEAFGELIESSGDSENSYQFAGEQFDEELGDYYLRDRFYDSRSGRFARRDTYEGSLTDPISLHKYLYANSNPNTYIDPSGYVSIAEQVANIVAIGILAEIIFPDPVLSPTNSLDVDAKSPWAQRLIFELVAGSFSFRQLPKLAYSIQDNVLVSIDNLASESSRNFGAGFIPLDVFSEAAKKLDKGGLLTKAGRALQKHSGRPSSSFPVTRGNESALNQAGQNIVDDILTDPGTTFTRKQTGRFGEIIDVVAPDGRGIRYSKDGEFIHLLEP